MYAITKEIQYRPKAKTFWEAQTEASSYAEKYRKEINGKSVAAVNKAYGWVWNIHIYM